jgi:hypothetical protein
MNTTTMRSFLAIAIVALVAASVTAGVTPGKATGTVVVSGKATSLDRAWVVKRNALSRIVLAAGDLDEASLRTNETIFAAADAASFDAIVIQLDEKNRAEETFFSVGDLPAGLSVRELGTFEPKKTKTPNTMAGRVVFKDDGFSFSYDVRFEAPVVEIEDTVPALAADASPAEHAKWRLGQLDLEFTPGNYRRMVIDGNAERVKLFLDAGMPVETENALGEAIEFGHVEVAKVLIDAGADVNVVGEYDQTLVMNATSNEKATELIELLAKAGADVNKPNTYKIAPLAVVAEQGKLDAVKALLAAGAKVNTRNNYGGTALSVAVMRGYAEVVRTLIDAGADVKRDQKELLDFAKDNAEITAMLKAALKKK